MFLFSSRFCKAQLIFFLVAIFCLSCNRQKKADTSVIKNELQERTIVRVTEGQLMDFVGREGKTIADIIVSSVTYSKTDFILDTSAIRPLVEAYTYEISVKRFSQLTHATKEFEVWEAYSYSLENKLALEDNIQKLGTDYVLYSRPLVTENKLLGLISINMSRKNLVKRISNEKSKR